MITKTIRATVDTDSKSETTSNQYAFIRFIIIATEGPLNAVKFLRGPFVRLLSESLRFEAVLLRRAQVLRWRDAFLHA